MACELCELWNRAIAGTDYQMTQKDDMIFNIHPVNRVNFEAVNCGSGS